MQHQNYFDQKEANKIYAQKWLHYIAVKYRDNIGCSIHGTQYYNENSKFDFGAVNTKPIDIVLKETDSVSAVLEEGFKKKTCVLNFASYKNPGGMFIEGSNAQEECLCRESTLYPVLDYFRDTYYSDNNNNKNKALYLNRALYSPNIVFERNNVSMPCDVLTCAAPNYKAAKKYCNVSTSENFDALAKRCEFILDIMQYNLVKVPILGAFGCGVFGQDPKDVAYIFDILLHNRSKYTFDKVIFAIIPGPNVDAFRLRFDI